MARNPERLESAPDAERLAVNLPLGSQACYFVGGKGYAGQDKDESIINYNRPPVGQPGLWCKWQPSEDNRSIEWDQSEKFYDYIDWIKYIIHHFLKPWQYVLNGKVQWVGEMGDKGTICIENNCVEVSYDDSDVDPDEVAEMQDDIAKAVQDLENLKKKILKERGEESDAT